MTEERTYGLRNSHLQRVADNKTAGFHVIGMGTEVEYLHLERGGMMTIAGLWS